MTYLCTLSVVELDGTADQVLLVKFNMNKVGDSDLFCSVEKMRFNVNLPFVKAMLAFIQESLATSKPPNARGHLTRQPTRERAAARRGRKLNTAAFNSKFRLTLCIIYNYLYIYPSIYSLTFFYFYCLIILTFYHFYGRTSLDMTCLEIFIYIVYIGIICICILHLHLFSLGVLLICMSATHFDLFYLATA